MLMGNRGMRVITLQGAIIAGVCAVIFASLMLGADDFQWDWRHSEALTSKQSLRHAKVSATERAAIARAIANALKPEIGGMGGESQQELEDNAVDTPVKLVDLNGDGVAGSHCAGNAGGRRVQPHGKLPLLDFSKIRKRIPAIVLPGSHPVFHSSAKPLERFHRHRHQNARFGDGKYAVAPAV